MKRFQRNFARAVVAAGALCVAACSHAQISLRVLHQFGYAGDGSQPYNSLVQGSDGALYGVTGNGGSFSYGALFKLSTDGTAYSLLYSFGGSENLGQRPQAGVIQGRDGALYGTTAGVPSLHTVFKVNTNGTGYTVLHAFDPQGGDGGAPGHLVQGADGALYGNTMAGGANGRGIVFKLNPDGSGYSVIYNFSTNGSPYPGLMQGVDGALYGTAGGGSNGLGVIFKLNTNGAGYEVLHDFGSSSVDGTYPYAPPAQVADGVFYGTTRAGGANNAGTVYKLNSDGSGYAVLHSFGATGDGRNPSASALAQGSDGALYGTTEGTTSGTVYRLNPDGSDYSVLYRLDNSNVGAPRYTLSAGTDTAFYGTAEYGGGSVFQFTFAQPKFVLVTRLPDHTLELLLNGSSNSMYRIDASTNLVDWSALTNILSTSSTVRFTDSDAPNFARRFYRAVWAP